MKFQTDSQAAVKLTLALLLITSPAASIAAHHALPKKDYKQMAVKFTEERSGFAGWFAGLGLGVNAASSNSAINSHAQGVASTFLSGVDGSGYNSYSRAMVNKYGPMGNLFVGYGYLRDVYYAGFNLGVNFLGANTLKFNQTGGNNVVSTNSGFVISTVCTINSIQAQTKLSRGWAEPFIDIKLGGLITPEALAYAIVGTSYNTLTIKSNSTYSSNGTITTIFGAPPATPTATTISSYGYSTTKKFFGLRVGAGTEVLLTNHFGVGADYVYSFYPTYNTSTYQTMQAVACDAVTGCQATPAAVNNTTKTSLSDQQIMAKFIYHIG